MFIWCDMYCCYRCLDVVALKQRCPAWQAGHLLCLVIVDVEYAGLRDSDVACGKSFQDSFLDDEVDGALAQIRRVCKMHFVVWLSIDYVDSSPNSDFSH